MVGGASGAPGALGWQKAADRDPQFSWELEILYIWNRYPSKKKHLGNVTNGFLPGRERKLPYAGTSTSTTYTLIIQSRY